jgi:VanZ family protein
MLPELRTPRLWMLASGIVVLAAIVVNLLPPDDISAFEGTNDKVLHTIGYALLAVWFGGLYPKPRYRSIAASLVALGIFIEIAQGAMHLGRTADVKDALADFGGIALGLTLAWIGLGRWALWLQSPFQRT